MQHVKNGALAAMIGCRAMIDDIGFSMQACFCAACKTAEQNDCRDDYLPAYFVPPAAL
jgi:hypothetical protein